MLAQLVFTRETINIVIPANQRDLFLNEWNSMFGVIKGDNLKNLIKLARKHRLNNYAIQLLKKNHIKTLLLATLTLGHMRERTAIEKLLTLLTHRNPVISLSAARSLLQIDDRFSIDIIIETILHRQDWPWSNVAHMLKLANHQLVCNKLNAALRESPVERQPGILRYLETCQCLQSNNAVVDILSSTTDDRVASTCLHIITDPHALTYVRKFTQSSRWHVRMHAATALGRLGNKDDTELLLSMTSDPEWWVRYRAAQSLVYLPDLEHKDIIKLSAHCSDRYARDIINHVLAEESLQ